MNGRVSFLFTKQTSAIFYFEIVGKGSNHLFNTYLLIFSPGAENRAMGIKYFCLLVGRVYLYYEMLISALEKGR